VDQLHPQALELRGAQALELRRGGPGLERLRLLDQRAHHEALPPGGDLLADALVGARPRPGPVDDMGLDRQPALRQVAQDGGVEVAVGGERKGARDRRGGHVERVRAEPQGGSTRLGPVRTGDSRGLGVERRALAHAEAVLLVHHDHREIAELDGVLDQRVGPDDELELPRREPGEEVAPPGCRGRAGEQLERQRAAQE
jgi:hypothetical protein